MRWDAITHLPRDASDGDEVVTFATPGAVDGLTSGEAAARLRRDGPNELPTPPRPSWVRLLAGEMLHFFALLLWVTSGLAWIGGMLELAVAITAVVVVNALFAFALEMRASRASERLHQLLPRRATVRRDCGAVEIDVRDIVVGDLLLLSPGDRVPADGVVVDARGARVDTSTFSGESVAADVRPGDAVLAGTFSIEGEIDVVVEAVGAATRLAEITRMTVGAKHETTLTRELRTVVHRIASIAVGIGLAFLLVMVALGEPAADGFLLAIGVTVALVPEALLPTVTLSLAWGAEKLAQRRVIVRNLEAVETLGSTTIICTDKTGTLTRNEMTVVEAWVAGGRATAAAGYAPDVGVSIDDPAALDSFVHAARTAVSCSNGFLRRVGGGWQPQGDPMEVAVDVFARRLGVDTDEVRSAGQLARFPFDPRRRRMSVVTDDAVCVKGAPDAVVPLCAARPWVEAALADMTRRGLRVLAVAARDRSAGEPVPAAPSEAEADLTLLAVFGLEDPPREDVAEAIGTCRGAGIRVIMVTGDHPTTAVTIASEVGLLVPGAPVVVGHDLPGDDEALGRLVDQDGAVIARVSPEDKLRIARSLRARGHVVAMTGDGVNDGPAMHEADIGIAMGRSGTDVAREASDLVLLDDHFATIVAGVEQGRATYVNVRRFLTYHLTDNVAELTPFVVWAISGGRIPLALSVLQILALDIGTDTLSATALGAEPPRPGLLAGPPVSGRLLNRTVARRAFGVFGPFIAVAGLAAFFASHAAYGWTPGDSFAGGHVAAAASGATFMTIVLAQTANAFACRSSTIWPGRLGWTSNRLLVPAASLELAFSLVALLLPAFADALGHAAPPAAGWAVAFLAAGGLLFVDWTDKRRRRRGPSYNERVLV